MPLVTVELNAKKEMVGLPIIWRLGKLFHVVTNIQRARVTEDYGMALLDLEGSITEIEQATGYLKSLGVMLGGTSSGTPTAPEDSIPQPNTIYVRLSTVNAEQGHMPLLHRVGKDYSVVVNIAFASFDEEEGGAVEITLSGALLEVQRSIAYLHTTGLHVSPRQRSVTDNGNL